MSDFHGEPYNFNSSSYNPGPLADFKQNIRAGEEVPDFTLPTLDGTTVTLSDLRGKPVLFEFGSIT
jgi:cytochrome oxidase Cu insertion factor (SCO1/SenC/PrrC family)